MATVLAERRSYSSPAILARRQRILATARELIAERGYASFTSAEVSARAGVAKQTVYNIFGSKERIVAASVDEYFEEREQRIHYVSQPATLERMIERQVAAGRASASLRHYLSALMSIYFAVDVDADVIASIHNVMSYPHRAWIEAMAERGELAPWVDASELIDEVAAHTAYCVLEWCRERIDLERSLLRRVQGSLIILAGSTTEAQREAIEARLADIVRNGLTGYPAGLLANQPVPQSSGQR